MRDLDRVLTLCRATHPMLGRGDRSNGFWVVPRGLQELRIVATRAGAGWDHVSVSCIGRTPTWDEMEWVRRQFFEDHETVIQIHPPVSEYVNCHPHCLHLWRPVDAEVPRPPRELVGGL